MTIGIVDLNSFYCSAELLFQPWYRDGAVCVASNNDGAIVARNDLAKAAGIKMGQPVFELRDMIERGQLKLFSSNYELYQSLSNRVAAVVAEQVASNFQYSVDEWFITLDGMADAEGFARGLQADILRRVGLPVGVGIAPTKTLAKLANWAAKKWKAHTGCVVSLEDPVRREKLLRYAPVGEVWGIGSRLSARLGDIGIKTAFDLACADPKVLRRMFNVNVERTARELNGVVCFPFADGGPERKQMIATTRSFGAKVFSLDDLEVAVAGFVAKAAGKLRQQRSLTNCLQVFASTSYFSAGPSYSGTRIVAMPYPTDDTRDLTHAALFGLKSLYREGFAYAKAGVILSQFSERGAVTGDLFAPKPRKNSDALMQVMDAINTRQGRGTIRLARDKGCGVWSMRRELLTPAYTTSWSGLPSALCR